MDTASEILVKYRGDLVEAIDSLYLQYPKVRGRKERSEFRATYEELVSKDTRSCGFRRFVKLK
jgi:hypothetical protein